MAEPNPYESPQHAPGRSRTAIVFAIVACLLFLFFVVWARGLPPSWVFDYDQAKYSDITKKIAADPQHLGGRPFDDVSRELGLEGIPWDDINVQTPGPRLMYHFRGFALVVHLEYPREGGHPYMLQEPGSANETLPAPHLLRIDSHHRPFVKIDGISSREERMRQYHAQLDAEIEKINKKMDSQRQKPNQ